MQKEFWLSKWKNGETAFHEENGNTLMQKHFKNLNLDKGSRIFIPLCGKTNDIKWLLENDYSVIGVEFSEEAIKELFIDLDLTPKVCDDGVHKLYKAENIAIFVGDFFELTPEQLGAIDLIYDRAALVALSSDLREKYAKHICAITNKANQILITFSYDQSLMSGPPFSIDNSMINDLYGKVYDVDQREIVPFTNKLKTIEHANELVSFLIK